MTLHLLHAFCIAHDISAEVDGDTMTADVYAANGQWLFTIAIA